MAPFELPLLLPGTDSDDFCASFVVVGGGSGILKVSYETTPSFFNGSAIAEDDRAE